MVDFKSPWLWAFMLWWCFAWDHRFYDNLVSTCCGQLLGVLKNVSVAAAIWLLLLTFWFFLRDRHRKYMTRVINNKVIPKICTLYTSLYPRIWILLEHVQNLLTSKQIKPFLSTIAVDVFSIYISSYKYAIQVFTVWSSFK